jgi:hypothetical protein
MCFLVSSCLVLSIAYLVITGTVVELAALGEVLGFLPALSCEGLARLSSAVYQLKGGAASLPRFELRRRVDGSYEAGVTTW